MRAPAAVVAPNTTPVASGIGPTNGGTGAISALVKRLQSGTGYRYQVCGLDAGYPSYVCVGPDAHAESSGRFTTLQATR